MYTVNGPLFGQMTTVNKCSKAQERGKFQGNTLYVIFSLQLTNSILKQSGHQIKGGLSASSPALMTEHIERMGLCTVKYWK